jgi:NAD(P)-dependent dehydrogenase (short-subunit alcohol dehydrogenase family)
LTESRRLQGRVAIVTGGGQGVGQGIAFALARHGMDIVLTGRTTEKIRASAQQVETLGVRALAIGGSVNDPETAGRTASEAIKAFGRIDVLVNNAHSFTPAMALDQMPLENMKINVESGLYGTFHCMQAVFPYMKDRGGSIINLGSYNGLESPVGYGAYSPTKEAIRALSRTAAREWGRHKIRVNVINPAALSPTAVQYLDKHPEHLEVVKARVALGYLGDPERDIGGVAVFLASEESQYVTGQTINADGGQWMF